MEVLDHQRERAQAVELREQRLEHLRLARRVGNRLAERPQRVDERRVREGAAAELQAVADENGYAGARRELRHEAALADPRLARHERERGRPRRSRLEHRQLVGAPDERGAGDAPGHDLRDGGRARGERAHRPAPLTWSRPGTGEEEAPRRSPRVKRRRTRPKRRAREAASIRSSTNWAAMTRALSECMRGKLRLRRRPYIGRSRRPEGPDPLAEAENPLAARVA